MGHETIWKAFVSVVISGIYITCASLSMPCSATPSAQKLDFQVLPRVRYHCRSDVFHLVIRSAQEWSRLSDHEADGCIDWLISNPSLVGIDFDHFTLLVASAGLRGCHPVTVMFDSVIDWGAEIRVHTTINGPGTCPCMPEMGVASAMALIRRTDKPIRFDVSNVERDCTHRSPARQ
jgi:hypothetical protein